MGQNANLVEELKYRLNANIRDVDAAVALGNFYYDENQAAESIVYYRIALDSNPNMPGVRTDLGAMYWKHENFSLAEHTFRQVILDFPDFGHAYINLGLLLQLVKNDIPEARRVWKSWLDKYPEHEVSPRARQLMAETSLLTSVI